MCNTDSIKVSIVMPIYNAYDYLRPAIDSVLDQTLSEIELICVDDGSTDHSLDILKEYQEADTRVRIVTENNAGPSWARNKGLSRARGEFVIFLDADDFYEPTLLEKLYGIAVEKNLDIAISDYDIYNDKRASFEPKIRNDHEEIFGDGDVVSKNEYPDIIFQCTSNYVWSKLFRRSFIEGKQLSFNQDLRVFEDVYFVMTALSLATRIGKCSEVLIHHRVYSEQSKTRLFRKYHHQVPDLYKRIKEFLMHNGMYEPLLQSYLNLSASRCYKIYNVLWLDAKGDFWDRLHTSYAEQFGWDKADPADIESEDVRQFVAGVLLHTHKQHLKKSKRGLKVRLEGLAKRIKQLKARKKIGGFFARMFGKKRKESDT